MKECFPEADTGERMFCYSKHVKGLMMKKYKNDPHRQLACERWFALLHLAVVHIGQACIGLPYIALLSSTCGNAIERNSPKNFS